MLDAVAQRNAGEFTRCKLGRIQMRRGALREQIECAVTQPPGALTSASRNSVLPLPRNPVSRKTGSFSVAAGMGEDALTQTELFYTVLRHLA